MVPEIMTGMRWPRFAFQLLDRHQAGLDVARVKTGFEQQKIHAAFDQGLRLLVVAVAQLLEGHVAAQGQGFGGGAHGSGYEARLL